jgi:gluconolactonase
MKTVRAFVLLTVAAVFLTAGLLRSKPVENDMGYLTMGTIERKDAGFDQLIPKNAVIEKLADGMDWTEGPVWVPDGKFLLYSDIPKNLIWKWKEGEGKSVYMTPAGYTGMKRRVGEPGSNGLTLDSDGRLVLCEHGDRRITRLEKNDRKTVLADKFEGKRFNSPNDLVYKSNGDLYFTDPPYGLEKNWDDPARELDFCGVFRLSKDGKLTLLTKDLTRPNGIAFSPDEKTLYIAVSDPDKAVWMAYDVKEDGALGKGRVFFDSTEWVKAKQKGLPDGMKVDKAGNLFATGPGGLHVFSPDGKLLGTLATGVATANCNWGDDGSVLYIAADKAICRVKTTTKGKGF